MRVRTRLRLGFLADWGILWSQNWRENRKLMDKFKVKTVTFVRNRSRRGPVIPDYV